MKHFKLAIKSFVTNYYKMGGNTVKGHNRNMILLLVWLAAIYFGTSWFTFHQVAFVYITFAVGLPLLALITKDPNGT